MPPVGLEPTTLHLRGECSNQLSYGGKSLNLLEAKLFGCFEPVAFDTPHIAFRDLAENRCPRQTVADHLSNFAALCAPYMIKFQQERMILAAFNARMLLQIGQQTFRHGKRAIFSQPIDVRNMTFFVVRVPARLNLLFAVPALRLQTIMPHVVDAKFGGILNFLTSPALFRSCCHLLSERRAYYTPGSRKMQPEAAIIFAAEFGRQCRRAVPAGAGAERR